MNQIVRTACCLWVLLLCLPSMAQSQDDAKKTGDVITMEQMEERLATAESDGSVITTDKMKERLESATGSRAVITNSTLSAEETTTASGAFTNEDLGSTDDSETAEDVDGTAVDDEAVDAENVSADEAGPAADAEAEPDAERERLIGEIESELDALAARVQDLQGDADDARLRETESKIEELRRTVDDLKKGQ